MIGSRYEETKDLDLAVIAKMIRAQFGAWKKGGEVAKHYTLSVRVSRYANGQSLRMKLSWSPESEIDLTLTSKYGYASPDVLRVQQMVDVLAESFNRNDSDSSVDYFSVRFYGSVDLDYRVTYAVKASLLERLGVDTEKMARWPIDSVRVVQDAYLSGHVDQTMGARLEASLKASRLEAAAMHAETA